jgi:hypothetical protein
LVLLFRYIKHASQSEVGDIEYDDEQQDGSQNLLPGLGTLVQA